MGTVRWGRQLDFFDDDFLEKIRLAVANVDLLMDEGYGLVWRILLVERFTDVPLAVPSPTAL